MRTATPRHPRRAFSLVEVIVTSGLVAVFMLGLVSLTSSSNMARDATRGSDLAREAARQQLEQVMATPFASVATSYAAPYTFAVPGLSPVAEDTQPGSVTIDTTTAPASSTLFRVVVTVRWRGLDGDRQMELSTYMADRT